MYVCWCVRLQFADKDGSCPWLMSFKGKPQISSEVPGILVLRPPRCVRTQADLSRTNMCFRLLMFTSTPAQKSKTKPSKIEVWEKTSICCTAERFGQRKLQGRTHLLELWQWHVPAKSVFWLMTDVLSTCCHSFEHLVAARRCFLGPSPAKFHIPVTRG